MANTEEGWHTCEDGEKLFYKVWKARDQPKARIILIHGFSDHCDNYENLFNSLNARGIEVFGFDQRGWGRSVKTPAQRGLSGPTTQVLDDITSILSRFIPVQSGSSGASLSATNSSTSASSSSPQIPLFLYGHSMGGGEVLHYASKYPSPHIRGYLTEAPYVGLDPATQPSAVTVFFASLAEKVMPRAQMQQTLNKHSLTRDLETNERVAANPLAHNVGTLQGLKGMLDRSDDLTKGRVKVDGTKVKSIWVGHGTGDKIVSFSATKKWFETCCDVDDKTFRAFDGWYHCLHLEVGGHAEIYAKEVADWILARS